MVMVSFINFWFPHIHEKDYKCKYCDTQHLVYLKKRFKVTMPSIVYGGLRYTQTRHAIYCKKCNETLESKHVHDFKMCSCGAVGIDGGISAGNRILGNRSDMEDRSMYCAIVDKKKVWLPALSRQ
jgi:hypothetical protein